MKIKSISGIVCYVKDPAATADFYEALGFIVDKRSSDMVSARVNWFWIDFHAQDLETKPDFQKEAQLDNKGAGQFLYLKVDDVDATYGEFVTKGLKPTEPKDWPWGNREFVVRDPDGYKLVFFNKA